MAAVTYSRLTPALPKCTDKAGLTEGGLSAIRPAPLRRSRFSGPQGPTHASEGSLSSRRRCAAPASCWACSCAAWSALPSRPRRRRPAASSSPTCSSRAIGSCPPSRSWPRSRPGPAPSTRPRWCRTTCATFPPPASSPTSGPSTAPRPDGKITVIFTVQDQANLVQKIVYNGAKHLGRTDDDLNTLTGLHVGMPLDPVTNKLACQTHRGQAQRRRPAVRQLRAAARRPAHRHRTSSSTSAKGRS